MEPNRFLEAVNGIIAAAPHGQQATVIERLIDMGQRDPDELMEMLSQVEPTHNDSYLQDFYRSKGSNILRVASLAETIFDNPTVMELLDRIDLSSDLGDGGDDEDLYNSEGDGYSH